MVNKCSPEVSTIYSLSPQFIFYLYIYISSPISSRLTIPAAFTSSTRITHGSLSRHSQCRAPAMSILHWFDSNRHPSLSLYSFSSPARTAAPIYLGFTLAVSYFLSILIIPFSCPCILPSYHTLTSSLHLSPSYALLIVPHA